MNHKEGAIKENTKEQVLYMGSFPMTYQKEIDTLFLTTHQRGRPMQSRLWSNKSIGPGIGECTGGNSEISSTMERA